METWFLVALIAPSLWALVVLLDIYFTQKTYSEAAEGTVISAGYQGIVFFLVPFIGYSWPESGWFFFIGGMCFIWACHWYLRSLIVGGDGAMSQIVWNLSTLIVPVLAWMISEEILSELHYLGILIAFFGGAMLSWDKEIWNRKFGPIVWNMVPAVIGLSVSMTFQKRGFEESPDFFQGFLTYSMGVVAGGLTVLLLNPRTKGLLIRIQDLSRKNWHFFLLGESLSVLALFSSSLAIKIAPAVSAVAVIESLVPVFVMAFSIVLSYLCLFLRKEDMRKIYQEQIVGLKGKALSIGMIAVGVYLIS